ncbi:hypothetical protein BJX63DRAFT_396783 [Aspergillus granulosus]|uniref:Uncharacterized protein n=1 Tax=Aspergillus granulosus TaxID=176169 RepID=A0ABR4HAP8_9EURO
MRINLLSGPSGARCLLSPSESLTITEKIPRMCQALSSHLSVRQAAPTTATAVLKTPA